MDDIKKTTVKTEQNNNSLFQDACTIIDQAQVAAYRSVNEVLIKRNWLLGLRIRHEVLNNTRAEYGELIVNSLAKELSEKYGEGFTKTNLYNYIGFYQSWPKQKNNGEEKITDNIIYDAANWNLPNELNSFVKDLAKSNQLSPEDKILSAYEKICKDYVYDDNLISYIQKLNDNSFFVPDEYGREIEKNTIEEYVMKYLDILQNL